MRWQPLWGLCAAFIAIDSVWVAWTRQDVTGVARALLAATVAWLFFRREDAPDPSWRAGFWIAAPSLFAPVLIRATGQWGAPLFTAPVLPAVLAVAGALLAAVSLACLGNSFRVLPALRPIVTRGPYRLVRHPAYLGETILTLGGALKHPTLAALLGLAAMIVALAVRIRAEEQLLLADPTYHEYAQSVPARLLPGLW